MAKKLAKKKDERPCIDLNARYGFHALDNALEEFLETGSKDAIILILPHIKQLAEQNASLVLNAAADYLFSSEPTARAIKSKRRQIDFYENVNSIARGGLFSIYGKTLKGQSIETIIKRLEEDRRLGGYSSFGSALKAYYKAKALVGEEKKRPGRKPRNTDLKAKTSRV